jgi:hypothetical protein
MRIRRHNSAGRARRLGRAVGVLGLAAGASAGGLLAAAGGVANASPAQYSFSTLNNSNDPTFNQLLGLNAHGVIAGYFGSGAAGHPNKGYYLPARSHPARLPDRKLPRFESDPGHRPQRQRHPGRLLGADEHRD